MKQVFLNFYCCLLLFGNLVNAQTEGPFKNLESGDAAKYFEGYIKGALQLWKTPGLSVVVVKDKKVVFRKGFGVTELGKPDPFSTGTVSVCASTTKAMTAVCMGMLVDQGKVKWTDKLIDVFPGFRLDDPYLSKELMVRDLFTHNAGLGNADLLWVYGYSRPQIIQRMQGLKPAYSFHSSFVYQNLMYVVAGELIHILSGLSWEEFISQRLFVPLGMKHTYPGFASVTAENSLEIPHFNISGTIQAIPSIQYDNIGPAGGVWSCADDMGKWMLFLLDSATCDGKRLLRSDTFNELFRPQAMVTPSQFYPTMQVTLPHWMTYGLGWFQQDYRGRMLQFHTGSLDGAIAIIGLIPGDGFGIYIFGNLDHSEIRHALMYKAVDLWCYGDRSHDWSLELYELYRKIKDSTEKSREEKESMRVPNTHPSLPLESYCGKYENDIFGNAEIFQINDTLQMKLPNSIRLSLTHWNFDSFVGHYHYGWWEKSWIKFSLDTEGKISHFEMDGILYSRKNNQPK